MLGLRGENNGVLEVIGADVVCAPAVPVQLSK